MAGDLVLSAASRITCNHVRPPGSPQPPVPAGGAAVSVTGDPVLRVDGRPVLPLRPLPVPTVAGPCAAPQVKCTGVATITAGGATRLRVNGAPVLLAASFAATTTGQPPAAFDIVVGQSRLRAG